MIAGWFQTNSISQGIKNTWADQPLTIIMGLAVLFRLLAAIFARGWGMLDDHYLAVEAPQSWV